MRGVRAAVAVSALLFAGLPGLAGGREGAADPWAELHRPLQIPRLARGARCPVTPSRELSPRFAAGQGDGPVYPVGAFGRGLSFLYPVRRNQVSWYPSKWSGNKVAWFAAADFRGMVLIRGRQLDGVRAVRFGDGRKPRAELRLVFGPDDLGEDGWLHHGSYTRVRAAGCYAWQIDGIDFTDVVVFRALRVR